MKLPVPVDSGIKQGGSGSGFFLTRLEVDAIDLTSYFRDRRGVYQPLTLIVKDRGGCRRGTRAPIACLSIRSSLIAGV